MPNAKQELGERWKFAAPLHGFTRQTPPANTTQRRRADQYARNRCSQPVTNHPTLCLQQFDAHVQHPRRCLPWRAPCINKWHERNRTGLQTSPDQLLANPSSVEHALAMAKQPHTHGNAGCHLAALQQIRGGLRHRRHCWVGNLGRNDLDVVLQRAD